MLRQTDRQTDSNSQGKRISQGIEIHQQHEIIRPIKTAHTLDTKCGSLPGFWFNGVIEYEES